MFSHHLNFSPDIISRNLTAESGSVESRVESARAHIDEVRFAQGACETSSPFSFITEELVIKTLRSEESPETIYWLLRCFLEGESESPLINTDRGKTIYIEFDRIAESLSVYVGATDSIFCAAQDNGSKIYAMKIQDRYDYLWYAALGVVLKRHMSAEAIQEQAAGEDSCVEAACPTLFYTTGKDSACVMRTNWYQSKDTYQEPEFPGQTYLSSFSEYVSSLDVNETGGSNVLSVFSKRASRSKIRQAG